MSANILVVDDTPTWSKLTRDILEKRGYRVSVADSADKAMRLIEQSLPDLMILDIHLKGISGLQLCETLRRYPRTAAVPVLMLTVMKDEKHKVEGLTSGADDYLTKPFGADELAARVMALLRRSQLTQKPGEHEYRVGDLLLNVDRRTVLIKGRVIALAPKDFDILSVLMSSKGHALRKELITDKVWGSEAIVNSETLTQHIKTLRAQLGDYGEWIETVERVGYRFRDA